MEVLYFCGARVSATPPAAPREAGFIWLDYSHEEIRLDSAAWAQSIREQLGESVFDEHVRDCLNLQHPSFFDDTQHYDMIVFRKLAMPHDLAASAKPAKPAQGLPSAIHTRPITMFCFQRALVTVCDADSRTMQTFKTRLRASAERQDFSGSGAVGHRLPARSDELMLRLISFLVDRYMDLRQPLTEQFDAWQSALLGQSETFSNWRAILAARIAIRKLEALSEEQYDAMQEYRDSVLETPNGPAREAIVVRINDVMEHIQRVLQHARRLEQTAESAVQLNFSAQAHRTNRIVQILTVVTVIFAPLNLLAGLYGMNFERLPGAQHPYGFWLMLGAMGLIAALLLAVFSAKRYIDRSRR